jgi:NADH-quinone oxidoreductase subunit C
VNAGDQVVVWVDPAKSLEILTWLKDDPSQQFDMMSDVTGVDYGKGAVEVVYQMFSTAHKRALRVRCELPYDRLEIDSVVGLWRSANWLEREVYDLFGVKFKGHPDLRRILMPSDYAEGHPLRKDFPLRGRFSRAEQTRRALAQDVERFYRPGELDEPGRAPQELDAGGRVESND